MGSLGGPLPTRAQVIESYNSRFARGELRESERFYRWLLRQLPLSAHAHLLDVACGSGSALIVAEQMFKRTVGIDFVLMALNQAQSALRRSALVNADGEELPFADNSFDGLTLIGSLEHFSQPSRGLHEACRVLRADGWVAILVPNSYYLVDIVWRVWRTGLPPSHHQPIERFATFHEWHEFIEGNGLRIQRSFAYNFLAPTSYSDWKWYFTFPKKLLNLLIAPFIPFHLAYSFLYLCTKK